MAALPPSLLRQFQRAGRSSSLLGVALGVLLSIAGCARFEEQPHDHVYVSSRQVYLHDRVAAVSNRVALVANGEPLEVLEHGRRFYKVRTAKGEVGWLEEHAVIDQEEYQRFEELDREHAQDQADATAQLRDDLYLHLTPGRRTDHFLLIPGNAHVRLLARGSAPRAPTSGSVAAPVVGPAGSPPVPVSVPMEDWWLVRDAQGHVGWLLASRLDVDIPDAVGEYAEGQRMVAAYPLATVVDRGERESAPKQDGKPGGKLDRKQDRRHGHRPGSGEKDASLRSTASSNQDGNRDAGSDANPEAGASGAQPAALTGPRTMTEYLTLLAPPQSGLPYDFDQFRVFTWSLNHHRYETAYRLHGFHGYLPVRISEENVNGQVEPVFSFQIAADSGVKTDPDTGQVHPLHPRTIAFRLEGNITRRTGSDTGPIELSHDSGEAAGVQSAKEKSKKKKR